MISCSPPQLSTSLYTYEFNGETFTPTGNSVTINGLTEASDYTVTVQMNLPEEKGGSSSQASYTVYTGDWIDWEYTPIHTSVCVINESQGAQLRSWSEVC